MLALFSDWIIRMGNTLVSVLQRLYVDCVITALTVYVKETKYWFVLLLAMFLQEKDSKWCWWSLLNRRCKNLHGIGSAQDSKWYACKFPRVRELVQLVRFFLLIICSSLFFTKLFTNWLFFQVLTLEKPKRIRKGMNFKKC